jgi:hypothetical protein
MLTLSPPPNELAAWILILLGMVSGAVMGMRFQEEGFMGGYASRRRRLLRLGHISFFGLGVLNLCFAHSVRGAAAGLDGRWVGVAGWCMIAGGVLMPLCCAANAWRAAFQPLFAAPVGALVTGVVILLTGLVRA